jgi:ubiquinone/menaquinone biosynthesis C-methylase UbiE
MGVERTLTIDRAKRFYDRMGARQDWNRFYEDPAVDVMIRHADFGHAHSVVEFGCGTGRLAERLLVSHLAPAARYLGLDASTTMASLARSRLKRFGDRAEIRQSDGSPRIEAPDGSFDRFVSTYVFDLLSRADIAAAMAEVYRVLAPGGLLCAVSLTHGRTRFSRCVSKTWQGIWSLSPATLGGCRPIELSEFIDTARFEISHLEVVSSYGLSSEALVALKL